MWSGIKVKLPPAAKKPLFAEAIEENFKAEEKEIKEQSVKLISEEQKRQILTSEEMQNFIVRNYKFIERVF